MDKITSGHIYLVQFSTILACAFIEYQPIHFEVGNKLSVLKEEKFGAIKRRQLESQLLNSGTNSAINPLWLRYLTSQWILVS